MRKILVTGGTIFVSRYIAEYYVNFVPEYVVEEEAEVYVNTHNQPQGVKLIECDKNHIGNKLRGYDFDVVIAVNIYTADEMKELLDSLDSVRDFIFISSSAVYPETLPQPFSEDMTCGKNSVWGDYGVNKRRAEEHLLSRVPGAYILRPPYLYGKMNNLYREAFVFDCALAERPFFIPNDGSMQLQFFHVGDLCRFIDTLLRLHPENHIFNVGNRETETIKTFVEKCYATVGEKTELISVSKDHAQRSYFPFHDYSYVLDVEKMHELMPETLPMSKGLKDSFKWYVNNQTAVFKKPYFDYIDNILSRTEFE